MKEFLKVYWPFLSGTMRDKLPSLATITIHESRLKAAQAQAPIV
jgi:hypothetical protein